MRGRGDADGLAREVKRKEEVFCLFLFEGTFTSFFKIKSHKEVTKE